MQLSKSFKNNLLLLFQFFIQFSVENDSNWWEIGAKKRITPRWVF